jgi:hypothetical protein
MFDRNPVLSGLDNFSNFVYTIWSDMLFRTSFGNTRPCEILLPKGPSKSLSRTDWFRDHLLKRLFQKVKVRTPVVFVRRLRNVKSCIRNLIDMS